MPMADKRIPAFPPALKSAAKQALVRAADWAVRNQVRDAWPAWDANKGRFPYHVLIDPQARARAPRMLSTCWKTARAAQGLYSAYLVTGDKAYLASADLAMDYVATLQVLDPMLIKYHGAFVEDSPMGRHLALRDGMEAVQGFINSYLVTGNRRHLARALMGTDFIVDGFKHGAFPFGVAWHFEDRDDGDKHFFCAYAGAIVCAQMARITGNRRYVTRGAAPMMDYVLQHFVRPDGALGIRATAANTHHVVAGGPLAGVFINDDGLGVSFLSAYAVTGKRRYLDAAVAAADFWTTVAQEPTLLAAFPAIGLFLADMYRLTGARKYLPMLEHCTHRTLALQCRGRDKLLDGGFIGEDMAKDYDPRTRPEDYVDLRITSYALIHLAKVAARTGRQWSCAYSAFGW